jgi:hypothetical protein
MPEGMTFDLGIFDEAHKTTGHVESTFAFALQDSRLRITKRLFFTATPRQIDIRRRDKEGDFKVVSMDDSAAYGIRAHTLAFADAVRDGLICDYRVVVSVVDPGELSEFALKHGITLVQGDETATKWVATQLSVKRAIEQTKASKVITFHSSVRSAQEFAGDSSRGIGQFLPGFQIGHVNGEQPVSLRKKMLSGFASDAPRLVTNARCLTEGVDLPAVDMVAFSNPKRSKVDIIQAVGRAMRKSNDGRKEIGYVLVPILLPERDVQDLESVVQDTDWAELVDVLAALREHDVRLDETIRRMQEQKGEKGGYYRPDRYFSLIEVIGPQVELSTLQNAVQTAVLERLGASWDIRLGELKAYKAAHGDCNVPQSYAENPQLGSWVPIQRQLKRQGSLSEDRWRRLDEIGFDWDPHVAAWDSMFEQLKVYKAAHGDCDVPQLYAPNKQLGHWVNNQRAFKIKNTLPEDRIRMLNDIGFEWDPKRSAWDKNFEELKCYKAVHGDCNVPRRYVNNPTLASWVGTQRISKNNNRLSEDRLRRLDEIGFAWDPYSSVWEERFKELLSYKVAHGNCDVPQSYADNPQLGTWTRRQRILKRKGELSGDRLRRLDEIGFEWDPTKSAWDAMFEDLKLYKAKHGNCNVPRGYSNNPTLASWIGAQRCFRKKNKISRERLTRLNEIGFDWDPKQSSWEAMFEELSSYKAIHGDCNVPQSYMANERLGFWVSTQRQFRKRSKLSEDRIRRLEEIGFLWVSLDRKSQD